MEKKRNPIIIDGRIIAKEIKKEISTQVAELLDNDKRAPHLAAIILGDDPASISYVNSKEKQSAEVGFTSSIYRFSKNISQEELLKTIDFLNQDPEVDGFIVQLPLPKHIDEQKIIGSIEPSKDVDGFHPVNLGRMMQGMPSFLPATPMGIMNLINRLGIETIGKNCVIIGRSNIVGTPLAILMSRNNPNTNSTVTLCHSKTKDIDKISANADILIVAIGIPEFIKENMVKDGAAVIDVGINRIEDTSTERGYRLVGDVDFKNVAPKCSYITLVPGGVGPMTIVSLLQNTLKAYKNEIYKD